MIRFEGVSRLHMLETEMILVKIRQVGSLTSGQSFLELVGSLLYKVGNQELISN